LFGWVAPSFGVGDIEVGIPVGWYLEEGTRSLTNRESFGTDPVTLIVLPYGKFALVNSPRDKLSTVLQLGPLFVSSVSLLYGRDLRSWMPYGGVKWMASAGPAGDDPFITRYQQKGQLLLVLSVGAEWRKPGLPSVEMGVLLNHYSRGGRLRRLRATYHAPDAGGFLRRGPGAGGIEVIHATFPDFAASPFRNADDGPARTTPAPGGWDVLITMALAGRSRLPTWGIFNGGRASERQRSRD
jgi:hypothetical protein